VSAAGITARQARQFAKSLGAKLSGKERGRDRYVLRHSYDVDDARAKPWSPIGKGSVGEGLAHREALLQAAEEHRVQHWRENPRARLREARDRRAAVVAELAQIDAGVAAPPGRAATLRMERSKLEQLLDAARDAIRRIDVTISRP
jgi:hypothetical protein